VCQGIITGKDNAPLTENNAYTVATVNYGGYPAMDTSKLMSQEVATNILTSTNSQIVAGGSILINANVYKQTSDILAGTNLTINGNVTNNITHFTTRSLSESYADTHEECTFGLSIFCSTEHNWRGGSHTTTFSSLTPSRIAAGENLTISGGQISNDSGTATFQNNTPLGGSAGGTNSGYSGSYGSSFVNSNALNSANLASQATNLNSLSNPALFTINPNSPVLNLTNASGQNINFTYLYESNPAFNVQHNFLTSTYFFEHLDYSPSRQIILAADPYAERRTMEDVMAKTGMVQYLGNGAIDQLYANGLIYLEGRPTQVGYELTQSQINALQQDIIIPVEREVDGTIVIIPQAYFSAASLAKAQDRDKAGGQIYADGNVTLTSDGDLINKGYIASGGNTTLLAQGDLNNIGGEINAKSNLILSGKNVLLDALVTDNTTKKYTKTSSFFGFNLTRTITDAVTSSQIQNVSKLDAGGSILINSQNDFTAKGTSIHSVGDTTINAAGNVNIGATYSKSSFDVGDVAESNSKSVNTIIQTGTGDATPAIIQKAQDDKQIQDLNISLAGLTKQKTDLEDLLNKSDGGMSAFINIPALQNKLSTLNSQITDTKVQIENLKAEEITLVASIANTTGGNVSITAGKNVNIKAGTDEKSSHYHSEDSGFFGSRSTTNDMQSSQTMSELIAGKDVTINAIGTQMDGTNNHTQAQNSQEIQSLNTSIADLQTQKSSLENQSNALENQLKHTSPFSANHIQLQNQLNNVNSQIASADSKIVDAQTQISSLQNDNSVLFGSININASIVTGGGSGSLMTGNNLNVTSALNQYYAMNYHMETQMDVAALAVTIAVAVAVSVATAGAGAALMTSVVMSTALATSAATAALIAVGTQYGMSAAMSGGQHGTEAIQSGDADTTTTHSQTVIASSLLFGGGLNASVGNNANIDTAKNGSTTTSIVSTHTDIEPDYGSLVKDAAITGAIAGGTVVAGKWLNTNYKESLLVKSNDAVKAFTKPMYEFDLIKAGISQSLGIILPDDIDAELDKKPNTKSILFNN
jgi:adhesin HecA-like repeat protein